MNRFTLRFENKEEEKLYQKFMAQGNYKSTQILNLVFLLKELIEISIFFFFPDLLQFSILLTLIAIHSIIIVGYQCKKKLFNEEQRFLHVLAYIWIHTESLLYIISQIDISQIRSTIIYLVFAHLQGQMCHNYIYYFLAHIFSLVYYMLRHQLITHTIIPILILITLSILIISYQKELQYRNNFTKIIEFNSSLNNHKDLLYSGVQECLFVIKKSEYPFQLAFSNQSADLLLTTSNQLQDPNDFFSNLRVIDNENEINQTLSNVILKQEFVENSKKFICSDSNNQTFKTVVSSCTWEKQSSLLISLLNITDQIKKIQLQQLDQYKNILLATVSHDLKNPLFCIQTLIKNVQNVIETSLLLENKKEILKDLHIIIINTVLLEYLIYDIQDFTQLQNQSLRIKNSKFNIKELLQDVKDLFQLQCSQKQIKIKVSIDQQIEDIQNDENRLKQILINLISNSVKFTGEYGYIIITITNNQQTIQLLKKKIVKQIQTNKSKANFANLNEENLILISVEDTGEGISLNKQKQLFKLYSTFDNHKSMNKKGVGLGLVICKQLAGSIGPVNFIYIESQEQQGTQFQFLIYSSAHFTSDCQKMDIDRVRSQQNFQQAALRQSQFSEQSQDSISQFYTPKLNSGHKLNRNNQNIIEIDNLLKKKVRKLVLVDDESFNHSAYKVIIKEIKQIQQVINLFNGKQLIEYLSIANNLSEKMVVLLDITMPQMDGIQCLKQLNDIKLINNQNLIIIMVSGYQDQQIKNECLNLGAIEFLVKPISKQQLQELLEKL